MTKKVIALVLVIFIFLTVLSPAVISAPAQSQGQITVTNSNIQMAYPDAMNFSCAVKDNVTVTSVRLQYHVEQMTFAQVISEANVTFTPATSVNVSYSLNMLRYGQIPQGIAVDYWWVIKDASGNKLQTDPQHYVVADNNHTWQNLNQNKINLLWYGQNNSFGQTIMSTAQAALSKLANDTGASPGQTVNLSIYTSSQDYSNSVTGASEWSGGVTLPDYNSVILLIRPDNFNVDVTGVSHELTHVIVGQVTFNPYNSVPYWLNEGLAMYIQYPDGVLPSQFTTPFSNALKNNTLISVRSLSDPFSAYADKAFLSYAESISIVTYLIDQYGSGKMLQFLDAFKQGTTYDGALQSVYGFDMDGLFSQWSTWAKTQSGK
jgi:hypothetical protein